MPPAPTYTAAQPSEQQSNCLHASYPVLSSSNSRKAFSISSLLSRSPICIHRVRGGSNRIIRHILVARQDVGSGWQPLLAQKADARYRYAGQSMQRAVQQIKMPTHTVTVRGSHLCSHHLQELVKVNGAAAILVDVGDPAGTHPSRRGFREALAH